MKGSATHSYFVFIHSYSRHPNSPPKRSINRYLYLLLLTMTILVLVPSCAQQGSTLSGGAKDEDPPIVVQSTPENYSTNFTAKKVEVKFNEYIKLDKLKDKLVISPVMEEKPEIKAKGKSLEIEFLSDLLPDRTYTLNFGDALVDLNESNPLENYMYVFATGDKLDSLQMSGNVVNAFTNQAVEKAAVMLYLENQDSLPLTTLPTYLSITDENGQFNLKNLASGSYKIFALVDANANFLFDQAKEEVAFLDTLLSPTVETITDTIQSVTNQDSTAGLALDSLAIADSSALQSIDSLAIPDSTALQTIDSLAVAESAALLAIDSLAMADSIPLSPLDSIAVADSSQATQLPPLVEEPSDSSKSQSKKPKIRYNYQPANLLLSSFVEQLPKQNITSTGRPLANKIEVIFNEPLDSLTVELLYFNPDSVITDTSYELRDTSNTADSLETRNSKLATRNSPLVTRNSPLVTKKNLPYDVIWSAKADSISIWVNDTTLAARDSLLFVFGYNIYDSLEQKIPTADTIRFNFRKSTKEEPDAGNPFTITTNVKRTLELGMSFYINTSLPYQSMDPNFIQLIRKQDTLEIPEPIHITPDTLTPFKVIYPNETTTAADSTSTIDPKQPIRTSYSDIHTPSPIRTSYSNIRIPISPTRLMVPTPFLPDSSYTLTFLPGAFTSYAGLTNDTTKFDFKVNTEDKYGTIKITMEGLEEQAIIQLLNNKGDVVRERAMNTSGSETFTRLKPGKYGFKLIFDANGNGKWDTGRYLKHIQPERVLLFGKELELKANWEMDETWSLTEE